MHQTLSCKCKLAILHDGKLSEHAKERETPRVNYRISSVIFGSVSRPADGVARRPDYSADTGNPISNESL